jgi:List-Bact-rpt repeat protein
MRQVWKRVGRSAPPTLLPGLAVVLAALLVAGIGVGSTSAQNATVLRDRSTTDMPDDFQGPQVHFMYVVPADGTDNQLDMNGMVEQSIQRVENWMLGQTGNQGLRIDTYHGVPDITFFRLPHTDSQATSQFPWPLWTIGSDLVATGFNNPNKTYAVFYDGHSSWACGGATSPSLPKLGAMYLQGWPTADPVPCHSWGTGTNQPGYFDMGILHEVLHTIGFSPRCSPHQSKDGYGDHVNDSPTDIMYAPDANHTAPWDVLHAVLDYNHDDYYKANVPGCPDLSSSPYLTPMISADVTTNGDGTVSSNPAGISCPQTCTAFLTPPAVLTATPAPGQVFAGWSGACSGLGSCTLNNAGSVTAQFAPASYERSLSLRLGARKVVGTLKASVPECVAGVDVSVERRNGRGWRTVRRLRTDRVGGFSVSVPKGRASYRALAPATTVNSERCGQATSKTVTTR